MKLLNHLNHKTLSKPFKFQIEQELQKRNWEIVQIDSTEQWWNNEHRKICAKHNEDVCFYPMTNIYLLQISIWF